KMGKLSHTWSLMGASWQVLKQDKEILIFPLISGVCCLLILASFAVPLISSGNLEPPGEDATTRQLVTYYGTLFLFYFCTYFVVVFFNSAIIACATIRMQGGDPTVGDGFRAALARLPLILGWALVSATVGLVLRIIEDRSKAVGRIVAGLLGVVSFLVVPILVIEKKGPMQALKESTMLLKKTWGEQLIGNFSFGLIFFLLSIPAFILAALGVFSGGAVALATCIILAVIYLIVIALIQSALQAIFQAAVYLYARDGGAPAGFAPELLADSMARK
ncbi:MAG: DUF6159 family protein, partial [Planctomycetota bacterium]